MLTFDVCTKPLIFFSLVIHSGPKHELTLFQHYYHNSDYSSRQFPIHYVIDV